ncbi:MAG: murein L,D-transpeptidase catalytic domain family protein [Fusobacterium sp.]|nr:murein L,D-transpeptidase catalytic domain family protein [Fusobacterium sp.]
MYNKKFITLLTFIFISIFSYSDEVSDKYYSLNLKNKISFSAFKSAIKNYNRFHKKRDNIITIVDFTKPSSEQRLYVIDLIRNKILISSHVSHAKRTGNKYAKYFSNRPGSEKSCVGTFLTGNIYKGKNGASLRLHGLERGVNNNAYRRTIVVHGASYATPSFARKVGRLGRSKGCFAVPNFLNKKIIKTIVGGSVFYVYAK